MRDFPMKNIIFLFSLLLCCGSGGKLAQSCDVHHVVDGDTISLHCESDLPKTKKSIRLMGIDCPESKANQKCLREGDCADQIPKGKKAKARLSELLTKNVRADIISRDKYGRELGYVYANGKDVGLTLLQEGLCKNIGNKYPHPKKVIYDAAR